MRWVQRAMRRALIVLEGRSRQLELLDALPALLARTLPTRAAPAQATAWDVPLDRSGPCLLLTALLPARLAPQARTPLPSGLPP